MDESIINIIKKARENKEQKLSLWNKELEQLPDSIVNLTELKVLDLRGNQLYKFPLEITSLKYLEELYLDENLLEELPNEIESLVHLRILSLTNNRLASLPKAIGTLKKLEELSLRKNLLTELPESFSQLPALYKLYLGDNQFSTVPIGVLSLPNLKSLDLGDNDLDEFPGNSIQLQKLEQLYLSDNKLNKIELKGLCKLQKLYLNNNQLSRIPKYIGQLVDLNELILTNNKLSMLPEEIKSLKNLKKLDITRNQFDIPDSILKESPLEIIYYILNSRSEKLSDEVPLPQKVSSEEIFLRIGANIDISGNIIAGVTLKFSGKDNYGKFTIDSHDEKITKVLKKGAGEQEIREFGEFIFEKIFFDNREVLVAYDNSFKKVKRIRLNVDDSIMYLPWEFLYDSNEGYLGRIKSIVRDSKNGRPYNPETKNLLLVVANPHQEQKIDKHKEELDTFFSGKKSAKFDYTLCDNATRDTLRNYLQRQKFDYIHFVCHGVKMDQESKMVLENDTGGEAYLSGQELSEWLYGKPPQFIYLCTCSSNHLNPDVYLSGLAQSLVRQLRMPALVAMQFNVGQDNANIMVEDFYNAQFQTKFYQTWFQANFANLVSIENHIQQSRNKLGHCNRDWGAPVLYLTDTIGGE